MGDSVFMMVEYKPHDEEREADEQEVDKFSLHNTAIYPHGKKSQWGIHCIFWQDMLYS
jgi:hypothetical protein